MAQRIENKEEMTDITNRIVALVESSQPASSRTPLTHNATQTLPPHITYTLVLVISAVLTVSFAVLWAFFAQK